MRRILVSLLMAAFLVACATAASDEAAAGAGEGGVQGLQDRASHQRAAWAAPKQTAVAGAASKQPTQQAVTLRTAPLLPPSESWRCRLTP
jgi:hypothetical protein